MIKVTEVNGKKYVTDRNGRLVPEDTIAPSVLRDDAIAEGIVSRAVNLQQQIDDFRAYVRSEVLRRQRELLPAGTEATDDELLSRKTELRSYDGGAVAAWIVDRKFRVDVQKLASCKAALNGIVAEIPNKMAKIAISELLNLKSDRTVDQSKLDFLASLEIETEGWEICLKELKACFIPAGETAYPRCYGRSDGGKSELIPLKVSGGERI